MKLVKFERTQLVLTGPKAMGAGRRDVNRMGVEEVDELSRLSKQFIRGE